MKPYLFAGGLGVALVLAALMRQGAGLAEPVAPTGPADALPARPPIVKTVGTSSCASAACHGMEQGRAEGKVRRDEYRLWNLWDPHAHAYHALQGQRSKQIIANLGDFKEATKEPRCLVCHTDPRLAVEPAKDDLRVHGVGLESCHGSAERWLGPHHAKARPSREDLEQLGMTNLSEPLKLAVVCASCHVGAPPREGLPAREVTHDLLAAGHPRLNFELTVYLANLPPHWNVQAKAHERGPDFEARAWAAGQVLSARASIQLLSYQARRHSPWPEFAANDCESCHSPLRPQTNSAGTTLPMSRWTSALLHEVGAEIAEPAPDAKNIGKQLKELQGLLERPQPDPRQVADKAAAVDKNLHRWEQALKQWKSDSARLMKRISHHPSGHSWNWEEATQRYLALSALEQDRHAGRTDEQHQRIRNELHGLAEKLAFPPSYSGPRAFTEDPILDHFQKIGKQLGE